MTSTQRAILNAILDVDGHLMAEEIFLAVRGVMPGIALGTVYRNLNQFAEKKLIRRVSRANAPDYYEKNLNPHDHMVCIRCGRMIDIKVDGLKEYLQERISCPVISFDVTVNCLCRQCAETTEYN